jgi:hypothetical protein
LRGEFEAGAEIVALKVGKLREQILVGIAGGKVLQERLNGIPQMAHGGFTVANLGINRDAGKQRIHGATFKVSHAFL